MVRQASGRHPPRIASYRACAPHGSKVHRLFRWWPLLEARPCGTVRMLPSRTRALQASFKTVTASRVDVGLGGATQHVDMPGLNVRTAWREARDVENLLDRPSRDRSIAKVTARIRRVMISLIGLSAAPHSSLGPITASSGPHILARTTLIGFTPVQQRRSVRPGRTEDDRTEVLADIAHVLQRKDISLHVPERGQRLLDDASGEVIYDILLEVRLAGMVDADMVTLLMREIVIGDPEHVHFHARGHQRDGGSH